MSGRRGSTIVDAMVALSVLGLGAAALVGPWTQYERATRRARAVEGVTRVIDLELERARTCPTRACLEAIATATTAADGAESWARARVTRVVRPGPHGTVEVEISAEVPGVVTPRRAATRVWRP